MVTGVHQMAIADKLNRMWRGLLCNHGNHFYATAKETVPYAHRRCRICGRHEIRSFIGDRWLDLSTTEGKEHKKTIMYFYKYKPMRITESDL